MYCVRGAVDLFKFNASILHTQPKSRAVMLNEKNQLHVLTCEFEMTYEMTLHVVTYIWPYSLPYIVFYVGESKSWMIGSTLLQLA